MTASTWSVGSSWLRWDPHLHAPGTLRNDQFGDDWESYVKRIEDARPIVSALGITDYFTLRSYKHVLELRAGGALQSVPLVFPNVELRLTIETKDRQGVNLHLLVCPDDVDHVSRMEEKLAQLRFRFREEWFPCTDDGLRRLGKAHRGDGAILDEAAVREGANQFKVELSEIRKLFDEDSWIRENVLVAVAAGNDGLAGLAKDASFHAQREELGRFAHIVFSGRPADRTYWLGQHADFAASGQNPKPCLHGSDAHSLSAVLEPSLDRRCWIRAESTFDGLRQTLVEPERRVHVGDSPPSSHNEADTIRVLRVRNADWIAIDELLLNEGLVTIIGAKGSGKTALADFIAAAADADDQDPGPASFIAKAGDLLEGLELEIEWADGTLSTTRLLRENREPAEPRIRYLSQQFVERLCTPDRLAEPLVEEIERVVFSAIEEENRLECSNFGELREFVLKDTQAEADAEREAIRTLTQLVADETKLITSLPMLRIKTQEMARERKTIESQISKLPVSASDVKQKAHQTAADRLQRLKTAIAAGERRAQELKDVAAEIQRQIRLADTAIRALQTKYPALLDADTWNSLKFGVDQTAIEALTNLRNEAQNGVARLRASGMPATGPDDEVGIGLEALTAETEKLAKELGLDRFNAKRRADIEKQLVTARTNEEKARKEVVRADQAPARRKELQAQRLAHYERVFEAMEAEEQALRGLYAPLHQRVSEDNRLSKLAFVVQRVVNVGRWAGRGEALLDLRKPPFSGRGMLADAARKKLLPAWKRGSPQEVRSAMEGFIAEHSAAALDALAQGTSHSEFGEWLFSTGHISVRYSIQYEGVEITRLSPGTRGIVLLTLYLALPLGPASADHRPTRGEPRSPLGLHRSHSVFSRRGKA